MGESVSETVTGIAIAGAGAVAQALGRALRDCGINLACIASRAPDHAQAAAAFVGGGAVPVRYSDIPLYASHVIVAVSDRAITAVAEELARTAGKLRVALHTCGSHGPELLAPLRDAGVSCGGMHPLQTIRDPKRGAGTLRKASLAICGDAHAVAWAEEIAAALGVAVLHIDADARALYHAAAVMASNYVAALLHSAEQLMQLAGVPPGDARRALGPLVEASIENVLALGPVGALTGPVVRGDAITLTGHLTAIRSAAPSVAALYKAAGLHALEMARERGLSEQEIRQVRQALAG
jgi:predicted short-subunit dehydrogenase-like oxidoreductase (DUF2520 family)